MVEGDELEASEVGVEVADDEAVPVDVTPDDVAVVLPLFMRPLLNQSKVRFINITCYRRNVLVTASITRARPSGEGDALADVDEADEDADIAEVAVESDEEADEDTDVAEVAAESDEEAEDADWVCVGETEEPGEAVRVAP